jgi:membrane fusion protein (multidrug efflux system)
MEGQMGSRKTGGAGVNLLLVMVGLALGAAGALYAVRHVNTQPPATKAEQPAAPGGGQAAGPPPEVAVVTIQPERVTISTDLPGRTVPYLVAEVRPQVNGIVQKRLFKEGADVQAGDVLTQIDPAPFQAALDSAAAPGRRAEGRRPGPRRREGSQATVAQQQATLELAQTNRRRIESLVQDAAVSISERDKVVTEAKVAEAGLRSAQAQLNSSAEAVAEAEAGIEQAKAALETARINLEYTRITAPISGRIGKSDVTVGSLATAHQAVAFTTIQQIAPIYVDVTQSSANLLSLREKIAKGQIKSVGADQFKAKLILEDGTSYPHEGDVNFSDVTVEPSTGSFILRMTFPNPDQVLLPGMYVRAVLQEGVVEQGMLVPQQGVLRDRKGEPYALVVDAEGKVQQNALKLDRAIGTKWLVSSGLKPGDRVVIEGSQKAKPGTTVTVVAPMP